MKFKEVKSRKMQPHTDSVYIHIRYPYFEIVDRLYFIGHTEMQ